MYVNNSWLFDRIEVSLQHAEALVMNIHKAAMSFTICALYRPPSGNLHLFYEEFDKLINRFNNNDYIVIAGDLNIDVSSQDKYGVSDYLNILCSYGLENVINGYTREEHLAYKITKSSIDHIIARTSNLFFIGGLIKQKVAGHYFIAVRILKETCTQQMEGSQYKQIIDNKKVDYGIQKYNWNSLSYILNI